MFIQHCDFHVGLAYLDAHHSWQVIFDRYRSQGIFHKNLQSRATCRSGYYGYSPFATEPLTLLQTSMNKARETHTFPCLMEAFQVAWRSRLHLQHCCAPEDVLSRSWELQVASERLRLLQKPGKISIRFFAFPDAYLMLI